MATISHLPPTGADLSPYRDASASPYIHYKKCRFDDAVPQ